MKAIMLSVQPKWVSMIFNGKKTEEIRKRFPKNYRGWVYIYCTKEDNLFKSYIRMGYYTTRSTADDLSYNGKGKVVARFYCDNVEKYYGGAYVIHNSLNYSFEDLKKDVLKNAPEEDKETDLEELEWYEQFLKDTQLTREELSKYVGYKDFSTIHISQLEIFDKPKELSEFKHWVFHKDCNKCPYQYGVCLPKCEELKSLTCSPQSWQFIEVEL